MQNFNYSCVSCTSQLVDTGLLLSTTEGPFVYCEVCRTLYFVDEVENSEGSSSIVLEPTSFDPDFEFDLIRHSKKHTSLREYLNIPEERIVNPHFEKDLKTTIEESVTPSDLVRKLHNFHD